jgi:hypothetical protein
MTKPKPAAGGGDIGARLAEVADFLDRAVDVLSATLAEIRRKEEELDDDGTGRPDNGTGRPEGAS